MNLTPEYLKALVWLDLNKNQIKVLLYVLSRTWLAKEQKEETCLTQTDIASGANVFISKVAITLSFLASHRIIEWDSKKDIVKPLPEAEWTKKMSQPKEVGSREWEIFDHWNKLGITPHGDIGRHHPHIKAALRSHPMDEIKKAMENYATIVKGDDYFWTCRWPLDLFLIRGLDRFMDASEPFKNFAAEKKPKEESIYPDFQEDQ